MQNSNTPPQHVCFRKRSRFCAAPRCGNLPFLKRRARKCRQRHKLPTACDMRDTDGRGRQRYSTQLFRNCVATTCRALSLLAGMQRSALEDSIRIGSCGSLLSVCLRVRRQPTMLSQLDVHVSVRRHSGTGCVCSRLKKIESKGIDGPNI